MRASRGSLAAAAALSIGLAACGGAAPQAKAPEVAAGGTSAAQKPKTGGLELVKGAPKLPGETNGEEGGGDELGRAMNVAPAQQLGIFGASEASPHGRREAVKTEPFRLADLPRVEIPEPLPPAQAPIVSTEGEPAKDLFVDWDSALRSTSMIGRQEGYTSVRVSLRGHHLARIRIGNNEGTVTAGAAGGVYVVCRVAEDSVRRFVTARWESLGPAPGGEAALSIVDAWFDMHTCKATIVRRTRVPLKALAGGIFYGYREACAACSTGERVTFLSPNPQHIASAGVGGEATTTLGTLTRVVLPVRKGGGGSLVVRYSSGVLRDWLTALGRSESPEADVVAGIDIAQSVEDAEPIAVAYASSTAAPLASTKGRPPSHRPIIRHPAPATSVPPPPPKNPIKIPKPQPLPKSELADPFLLRSRQ